MACRQKNASDTLCIANLAGDDHIKRLPEGHTDHVGCGLLMADRRADSRSEVLTKEQADALVREADCGPDLSEERQRARRVAHFLLQLTLGGEQWIRRLRVELAGRDFEHGTLHGRPILLDEDDVSTVYVVSEGEVVRRTVETGIEADGNVEILSGLGDDEIIVVVGHSGLRSGSKVLASNAIQDRFAG